VNEAGDALPGTHFLREEHAAIFAESVAFPVSTDFTQSVVARLT